MNNLFRKGLTLLMVLCLLVPLFGLSALAADDEALPIDYRFEEVDSAQVLSPGMTNDPYSSQQWDMKMIGMEEAWRSGLTGRGVRVGIIDSGLSTSTMDIDKDRIEEGANLGSVRINIGSPTADSEGHGTFIAGIIGATKDNGIGIAGMAPEVTFVPIKIFSGLVTTSGAESNAVYAAVDQFHCNVLNLSFGTTSDLKALHKAIQYAVSKGVIVVSTVGNDGDATINYPGAYSEVISVGAVDKDGNVCSFSNKNSTLDVVAPGEKVLSLGRTPMYVYRSDGTSFSAPFVVGLAAMLKQAHPAMNTDDFRAILQASCKDLCEPGYDTDSGWGLIQVPEAIRAAAEYFGTEAPDMSAPEAPSEPESPWDGIFSFDWLRDLFQSIISKFVKGWAQNLSF